MTNHTTTFSICSKIFFIMIFVFSLGSTDKFKEDMSEKFVRFFLDFWIFYISYYLVRHLEISKFLTFIFATGIWLMINYLLQKLYSM